MTNCLINWNESTLRAWLKRLRRELGPRRNVPFERTSDTRVLQRAIPIDLFADDPQAVLPELRLLLRAGFQPASQDPAATRLRD